MTTVVLPIAVSDVSIDAMCRLAISSGEVKVQRTFNRSAHFIASLVLPSRCAGFVLPPRVGARCIAALAQAVLTF
jgi:hypothetical protein